MGCLFLKKEKKDNFDLKRSQDDPLDETENELQKQNAIQLRRNSVQSKNIKKIKNSKN